MRCPKQPQATPQPAPGRPNRAAAETATGVITLREAGPIEYLVTHMQAFLDRPIIDQTGLAGNFEWIVTFSRIPSDSEALSIFAALQRELGLKLEERTAPFDVHVIDSLEMPTEN